MIPMNDQGDAGRPDPRIEAMLEEALKASDMPAGLADRILQRTTPMLPRQSVLARIGVWNWARVAAAVVLLLAWTGVWTTSAVIVRDARQLAVNDRLEHSLERHLKLLDRTAASPANLELELDQLSQQLQFAEAGDEWSALATDLHELEKQLRRQGG